MKKIKKYKYHILILLEILCILVILSGCFKKEQLICGFQGTDLLQQDSLYFGDDMRLTPGVYQVRVESAVNSEQSLFVEIDPGNHYYNSFKGNGVTIFPGEEYTDFEVYVTETIPAARVQCVISNGNAEMLINVSVYKLNWGARILLFWTALLFAVFDMILLARHNILEGRISSKQQIVFLTLLGGVVVTYFPYCADYFSLGADTTYHLLRIESLKETLMQGVSFPIRIHSYSNYGHGSLIPSFYGDLFLYIPALLRLIGFPLMTAYKMFVFIVFAATAAVSYVSFKKCVQDAYAAMFGSLVCLFAPYRILNFNNRGAMGEYLAMVFIPFVCCGMYLLFTSENSPVYKRYKWWIIAGISAILHSHPLTAEMVVLFMIVVCIFFWKKTFRRYTFIQLLEATVIVLLINCWFLLPMVYLLSADTYNVWSSFGVSIQGVGVKFDELLLLLPDFKPEPAFLGVCVTILVVVYPLLQLYKHRFCKTEISDRKKLKTERSCTVFWALTLLAVVMTTKYFPWDTIEKIPIVKSFVTSLQFPAHFMGSCSTFMGLFAAFFLLWLRQQDILPHQYTIITTAVLFVILFGSALYHVDDIALSSSATRLYTAENMGTTNVWNFNFMPEECNLSDFYYHQPVADDGLIYNNYAKSGTTITMELDNTTDEILYLELPLTGYKGYELMSEMSAETPFLAQERGAHGDIRIAVPAHYQGEITVAYGGLKIFRVSEIITTVGIVLSLFLIYRDKKGKKQ